MGNFLRSKKSGHGVVVCCTTQRQVIENRTCQSLNMTGASHDTLPAQRVQALAQSLVSICF